jgi:hypothetical protein
LAAAWSHANAVAVCLRWNGFHLKSNDPIQHRVKIFCAMYQWLTGGAEWSSEMSLKQRIKNNPCLAILLVIFLGLVGGTGQGLIYGFIRAVLLVRDFQRQYPGRAMCGTGIVDLPLQTALVGALVGVVIGTMLGVWFEAKYIQSPTMNQRVALPSAAD